MAVNSANSHSPESYLRLEGLAKRFGDVDAVHSINLSVRRGELVAFLGPSGCGKTTTLRMIAGLAAPSGGRIVVGGRDVTNLPPHQRDMGLVFQSYALFPHMTVAGNVAFGLEMRGATREEIRTRVARALSMVQLEGLAARRPRELSGGQQQRVALTRALVIKPSILLLDEPLSNLDAKLRDEMRAQIREIQQQLGITTVFVTHDQVEALSICDRIVVMRNGRIEQVGTPHEIYERPANQFVAAFVGRTNRMSGVGRSDGTVAVGQNVIRSSDSIQKEAVDIMVRPHRIRIDWSGPQADHTNGLNRMSGKLSRVTFVGDLVQYHVGIGEDEIIVEEATAGHRKLPEPGMPAWLSWKVEDTFVFGREA
jgi:putative spermidine/putrescine transport system ATP-binding protein